MSEEIQVVGGLHHVGVAVGASDSDIQKALEFYTEVLGLEVDSNRPNIRGLKGYFLWAGGLQIHLMGRDDEGVSERAKDPLRDARQPHFALAVADIQQAYKVILRLGLEHMVVKGIILPFQLFLRDPYGNLIELHQADKCGCVRTGA